MQPHCSRLGSWIPFALVVALAVAGVVGVISFGSGGEAVAQQPQTAAAIHIPIAGIHCAGCRTAIQEALAHMEGVASAEFCHENDTVVLLTPADASRGVHLTAIVQALDAATQAVQSRMSGVAYSVDEAALRLTQAGLVIEGVGCCSTAQVSQAIGQIAGARVGGHTQVSSGVVRFDVTFGGDTPATLEAVRHALPSQFPISDVVIVGAACPGASEHAGGGAY